MIKSQYDITNELVERIFNWMGRENIVWFKHIKGLKGKINCVLRLNFKKKRIPAHPIHFREGMQIRNYLRTQPECAMWNDEDFDREWVTVIEKCIEML